VFTIEVPLKQILKEKFRISFCQVGIWQFENWDLIQGLAKIGESGIRHKPACLVAGCG
jgi:hypothetical protein